MRSSLFSFAVAWGALLVVACADPSATFEAACSTDGDCGFGSVCLRIEGAPERAGRCVPRTELGDVVLDTASPDAPDTRPTTRPDMTTSPPPPDTVTPPPDTRPPPPDVPPTDVACPGEGIQCGTGCLGDVPPDLCGCRLGTTTCRDGDGTPQCLGVNGRPVSVPFEQPEMCGNGVDDNCDGQIDEGCMPPDGCEFNGQVCDPFAEPAPEWTCVDLQQDGTGVCRPRCTFDGCEAGETCISVDGVSSGYCTPTCKVNDPDARCPAEIDGRPRFCQLGALLGSGFPDFCVASSGPAIGVGADCSAAGLSEFDFCKDNGFCLQYTQNYIECLEVCSSDRAPLGSSPHPDCTQPGATCIEAFNVPEFGLCVL